MTNKLSCRIPTHTQSRKRLLLESGSAKFLARVLGLKVLGVLPKIYSELVFWLGPLNNFEIEGRQNMDYFQKIIIMWKL